MSADIRDLELRITFIHEALHREEENDGFAVVGLLVDDAESRDELQSIIRRAKRHAFQMERASLGHLLCICTMVITHAVFKGEEAWALFLLKAAQGVRGYLSAKGVEDFKHVN